MPATDVLNPSPYWDETLQDSMCPNYGFERRRATTQLNKKAVGGVPWTRETANTGHSFNFSWLTRSLACAKRLKRYYEQYEDGFFTIIDWDDNQRHYVGRFTTPVVPVEVGNGMWSAQGVTFEEIPTVAMVKYPGDWDNDAIRFYAFNDFVDQKLATLSNAMPGWAPNERTILGVPITTMDNPGAGGNAGDWATYEYRGYGFKLYLMKGPEFGECTVTLDGNAVGGTIDCYAAADIGPQCVLCEQNVPLDIHDVQVIVSAAKNGSASAPAISWHSMEVMR